MRNIKIYSTITGGRVLPIGDDVTTWGQLKGLLDEAGIEHEGYNVIENTKNTSLVNNEAILPQGEFLIALTPIKTKSGAFDSYKDLRNAIKELVDSDESAKDHFNEGKNYTNKSRADLEELYENWITSSYLGEEDDVEEVVEPTELATVSDITNAILNLDSYDENMEAYDAAIELLENPVAPKLSSAEIEWAKKMGA